MRFTKSEAQKILINLLTLTSYMPRVQKQWIFSLTGLISIVNKLYRHRFGRETCLKVERKCN